MKRIGLFGGTFNPIHVGHIQVIQEVKKGFGLDKIFIIPSALPPHKEPNGLVDAEDRIKMIRESFSNHPDFAVSDVELKRSGPSYTIDTVHHFRSFLPQDVELFLIMGLDAFLEIHTWKSYKNLFLLISFIVMSRGAFREDGTVFEGKTIEDYLNSKISKGYKLSPSQSSYIHKEKKPVFIFNVTPIDISSTKIRKLIKTGRPITSLVPEIVEAFIKHKGLYL